MRFIRYEKFKIGSSYALKLTTYFSKYVAFCQVDFFVIRALTLSWNYQPVKFHLVEEKNVILKKKLIVREKALNLWLHFSAKNCAFPCKGLYINDVKQNWKFSDPFPPLLHLNACFPWDFIHSVTKSSPPHHLWMLQSQKKCTVS